MSLRRRMPSLSNLGEMQTFEHHDSIYSFMILFPELHRVKFGSYWSFKVFLAFVLFGVNIAMQITLTQVTGFAILRDNLEYRDSLVNHEGVLFSFARFMGFGEVIKVTDEVTEEVDAATDMANELVNGPIVDHCCQGPRCDDGMQCCSVRGTGNVSSFAASTVSKSAAPVVARSNTSAALVQAHGRARSGGRAGGRSAFLGPDSAAFVGRPGGRSKGKKDHAPGGGGGPRTTVCYDNGKTLDCTQPIFSYISRWDQLDFNGDGVWSREESEEDEANLACHLSNTGLAPKSVFRSAIMGLSNFQEEHLYLVSSKGQFQVAKDDVFGIPVPMNIQQGLSVPHKWFKFWVGLVALCAAVDTNRCGQLIQDGVFDGVLADEGKKGGLKNLNAALNLCQEILRKDGFCDRTLPVTYMMYRRQAAEKCGEPSFGPGGDYVNPNDKLDQFQTVEVNYGKMDTFAMARSGTFRFFLLIILVVWFVNLLGEISMIINLADFVYNFPVATGDPFHTRAISQGMRNQGSWLANRAAIRMGRVGGWRTEEMPVEEKPSIMPEDDEQATPRDSDGSIVISSISRPHKFTIVCMVIIRSMLVFYMAGVGSIFILTTYSYPELLMNAVALAFVFELPGFLFELLVDKHERDILESVTPLEYQSSLPEKSWITRTFLSSYFLGLVFFPFICCLLVQWDVIVNITPAVEALECLCLQKGPRCVAQRYFRESWWQAYWTEVSWIFGG